MESERAFYSALHKAGWTLKYKARQGHYAVLLYGGETPVHLGVVVRGPSGWTATAGSRSWYPFPSRWEAACKLVDLAGVLER